MAKTFRELVEGKDIEETTINYELDEALKKIKGSFELKGGRKGTYYIDSVGNDSNGNYSYMIAKGSNKAKKIQHQGDWGSKFVFGDTSIDAKTEAGIIEYYEEFLNEASKKTGKRATNPTDRMAQLKGMSISDIRDLASRTARIYNTLDVPKLDMIYDILNSEFSRTEMATLK